MSNVGFSYYRMNWVIFLKIGSPFLSCFECRPCIYLPIMILDVVAMSGIWHNVSINYNTPQYNSDSPNSCYIHHIADLSSYFYLLVKLSNKKVN
jgi:hypothetical protein